MLSMVGYRSDRLGFLSLL